MPKGFFITGTDTGVGKTIMAGAVIKAVNYLGLKTAAMKPIESGCGREGEILMPYDGIFLKQFAHMDEPVNVVTPCCFESPLAPLPASEAEQTEVDIDEIKKAFALLSARYDAVIVEGLGGLMVPVKKGYFVTDLAGEFGLPLLIVARPGLGTINHIMLTVIAALQAGLQVAGIILNYSHPPDNSLAEKTNPALLSRILPVPVVGTFPYLKNIVEDAIERTAIKNLNLDILGKYL